MQRNGRHLELKQKCCCLFPGCSSVLTFPISPDTYECSAAGFNGEGGARLHCGDLSKNLERNNCLGGLLDIPGVSPMLILLNHRSMQTCHCACSTRGPVITQKPLYRCCFSNNNYSTLANFAEMWILVRLSCHKAQWHFADTSPQLVTRPQARLLFFNASILETTSLLFSLSSVNRGLNMIFPKPFFLFFFFFFDNSWLKATPLESWMKLPIREWTRWDS